MRAMHTTSTRPWRKTILLFSTLFVLLFASPLFAEEGTQEEFAPMPCEEVFRFCEADSHGDSRLWEECVKQKRFECVGETIDGATSGDACRDAFELCSRSYALGSPNWKDCLEKEAMLMDHDPQCPNRWKEWGLLDEPPMPMPPPSPREEWNRGGWGEGDHGGWEEGGERQEGESWEDEGEGDDGEGAEGEEWLADLEENLEHLDEETQECARKKIKAAIDRCAVSDVPGCAGKVAMKKLVTEAQCGGEIFDVVELKESNTGEDHDFQESYEEHRESGGGCVPRHATLEGVKDEMFGMAPEQILEEFERRKHWMAKMASEHGGNPEEMMEKFESMPACEEWNSGERHGPPMGMPGMMGGREGMEGPSIGEVFGRAVGMLVELSQRSELNDEQKALVRETLAWFSDALNRIASGEDGGSLAAEARGKIEKLMATMGGGDFMGGGPNIEMMRAEIERMLEMVKMMVEKIPQAMAMIAEMTGKEVEGWEKYYDEIKEQAVAVEETCRSLLSAASAATDFQTCFNDMHELFENDMNKMGDYVSKFVSPDTMRAVEEKMGFNEMGMPGEHRGPPEGMEFHEGEFEGEGQHMGPPMMGPSGGMHVPEEYKRIGQECLAQGRPEEECRKELERAMFDSLMKCDGQTGGNAPECMGRFRGEFGLPPSEPLFQEERE